MFLNLGEVRDPTENDFSSFLKLCEDSEGWTVAYNKANITVTMKDTHYSSFKMFKVKAELKVNAKNMYECLQDALYRPMWDKNLIDGYQQCRLHSDSDIGYYALKSPLAFKNRDFVTQRCWRANEKEYIIFNHSVFHKALPPKKDFVRGISYVTGYKIRPLDKETSELIYITQSNPRGHIPSWAMNTAAKLVIPKIVDRFHKAAIKYPAWKQANNPSFKPWEHSNQGTTPFLDLADILKNPDIDMNVTIEENVVQPVDTHEDFDLD